MAAIKVTNPERVIDKSEGITKVELVRYYESIASRMLPHLKDRPLLPPAVPSGLWALFSERPRAGDCVRSTLGRILSMGNSHGYPISSWTFCGLSSYQVESPFFFVLGRGHSSPGWR
ncbi:hypothetical protein [Cupriavidus sp. AcVe19-1a]|uniref:non-homologous end-joining DNA ligase LigD n=1 Tax=Cupriavidus sp. AcVe19-1a TaxID=2821359 RepID=UPI001FD78ADE|nr:hypothetical protein [Cupriavidus sp. AcVe19-1a]